MARCSTLVAAQAGTPTGTAPARVVAAPADTDRVVDQLSENQPGSGSATTVNAALTVASSEATRARTEAEDLTLEQAAVFAEDSITSIAELLGVSPGTLYNRIPDLRELRAGAVAKQLHPR